MRNSRNLCFGILALIFVSFNIVSGKEMNQDELNSILRKAEELYRAKEYDKAVEQYDLVLQSIKDAGQLYNAACTYSLAGKLKKALSILNQAVEAGWDAYDHMNRDPDLDNIRDEPEFKALMGNLFKKIEEEEKKLKFWFNPGETLKVGEQEYELVGRPADTIPETARAVRDLHLFNEEIYLGYGDGMKNLGPVALISFQPDNEEWKYHFMLQEHLVTRFRQIGDELFIPGREPYEGIQGRTYIRNYDFGNIYRLFKHGGYAKYRTVPAALHIQDIDELNGDFFCTAGTANEGWIKNWGCIYQSKDGCVTWYPAYNLKTYEDTVARISLIRAFQGNLYAFSYAFNVTPDEKYLFYPDILGEKEAIVYDTKTWHTEDLIQNPGVLDVSHAEVFNKHLILNARFYDPNSDSLPLEMVSRLYIYDGAGNARKTLDYPGLKIHDIFIADNGVYILLQRDGKQEVLYSQDLVDFETLLYLPEELNDVSCIAVYQKYLYFGTEEGMVYRIKL